MAGEKRPVGDRLVLSTEEPLIAGGLADTVEAALESVKKVAAETAFLWTGLLALDQVAMQNTRDMSVEIVAAGGHLPAAHVGSVFARKSVAREHPKRERL
jgi:hypothetical protein